MDASEQERDVVVQKFASDLIADFDRSLEPFLRKPNGQLRRRVRSRETSRLLSFVLEPFQELPQLLDPHLPKWLPTLASAYLESLQERRRSGSSSLKALSLRSQLLMPLHSAVSRIIYTFCKIRGEKVVVRFLNVETRYLELLLLAVEDSAREAVVDDPRTTQHGSAEQWTWYERFIVLLWLSQLFFAPFDLSTISSGDVDDLDGPVIPGFQWPPRVPGITLRVIPIAIHYLESPGKERDGAKVLLVRVAMRRDMQELGILGALVQWALWTLKPTKDTVVKSPYYYIGSLSFLAGILRASENTSIMNQYLTSIFYETQALSAGSKGVFDVINESALARKMLIKVTRSIITLVLRKPQQDMSETEMVESSIGHLLERLADNDTPVRLAASKALSIITQKLDSDMASQVIEAVLESLNRNVLWVKNPADPKALPTRDLTAVDPSEWHGLMLTLAHLLYRRSPPPEKLSDIIHALLIGLSFEKRNPSGGSVGTNVRDASCFGIWAVARRYSTEELLQVQTKSVLIAKGHDPVVSILQVIATELVVTASLDPAGNIRRGASAALQELIGRHPDTIEKGISVVQTVDYHAVALRSRAIHQVAAEATELSSHYGRALLEATLGWRGIGDMDAGARRVAATSFGTLTAEMARTGAPDPMHQAMSSITLLLSRLEVLPARQVEERHGLLLSLAAVFDILSSLQTGEELVTQFHHADRQRICTALSSYLRDSKTVKFRKPVLIAEAMSRVVVSSTPILLLSAFQNARPDLDLGASIKPGSLVVREKHDSLARSIARKVDTDQDDFSENVRELLPHIEDNLNIWLDRSESQVVDVASEAALVLLILSKSSDRARLIKRWLDKVREAPTPRNKHGSGYFHAVVRAYTISAVRLNQDVLRENEGADKVLVERWSKDRDVETRAAILQSLTGREILRRETQSFVSLISEGLDDYTTTARGDIGSHVRLEAIKATKTLWETWAGKQEIIAAFYPRILRLAAEKLDRVRSEAQSALSLFLHPSDRQEFADLPCSSREYYNFLFQLCDTERLDKSVTEQWIISPEASLSAMLAGLVTSADTGNEDLVIVSRTALAQFSTESHENVQRIRGALMHNLKQYQGQDRVIIPTMEVIAYMFHVGVLQQCKDSLDLRQLCLLAQKAAYKTGNVRKLEACVKVYGAIAALDVTTATASPIQGPGAAALNDKEGHSAATDMTLKLVQKRQDGILEARRRLGALLIHPWPRIRNLVVDELWVLLAEGNRDSNNEMDETASTLQQQQTHKQTQKLLSIDWGTADKSHIKKIVGDLGLG